MRFGSFSVNPPGSLGSFSAKGSNSFGAVRLFAAIAVIYTHAFSIVGGWQAIEPMHGATGMSFGAHAVHVFFALSGFMVAASWERCRNWVEFVIARVLRIFPALITVNLAIVLIGGVFLTTAAPHDYWTLANVGTYLMRATLLFSVGVSLDGVFADNPIPGSVNIPIWTIRFEVICYATLVAFMATLAAFKIRPSLRTLSVFLVLGLSAVVLSLSGKPDDFRFAAQLARFVFAFYLGVGFWVVRAYIPMRLTVLATLTLLSALSLGMNLAMQLPMMIATTAYGGFWLGSFKMGWLQRTTDSLDLSYGVYITGFFIQQLLVLGFPDLGVLANATLSTAVALVVAWLSWTCIEKPALGLRKRIWLAPSYERRVQRHAAAAAELDRRSAPIYSD